MTNGNSPGARLLFVIDNDFGALGTVTYLLHRQPLAARATVLVPRRAHELHQGRLPVATIAYQSLRDILDVVERESPDVVFLYSGYMLAWQRLLTIRELQRLVSVLRERGCRVATSDPFLGTFRGVADAQVPARPGILYRFLHAKRVERHVRRVADCLEGAAHVYPVPTDLLGPGGARRFSFFNPLYIRSEEELRAISAAVDCLAGERAGAPRWLFVLAQFDLEFQEKTYGRQGFVEVMAGKIRETLENGRRATFIGPAALTSALSERFAHDARVTLSPWCAFGEFEQRLLDAERVFFWQIFSTSAFLRLWHGLPVFFFDEGHVPRLLGRMREAGLECYYMGGAPIVLDIARPLAAARLAELSAGLGASARAIRERLARLPSPAELVEAIRGAA